MLTADTNLRPRLSERLEALRARPIEATEKGFTFLDQQSQGGRTAATIAADRPPLHQAGLTYPVLTLRERALHANAREMAAYCARHGVVLAPHGKTHMSPELAAFQIAHGAWAITAATISELRTYRGFGIDRLLLANELTDETGIAWLARETAAHPDFEPYCYADSQKTVDLLTQTYGGYSPPRPLSVLVEIGHSDGRTGCRTDDEAVAVAKAVEASGSLRLAGVAGYEGTLGHDATPEVLAQVTEFARRLRRVADLVRPIAPPGEFIVSAGGSTFFDVVTAELTAGDPSGLRIVLRSGAYLTHDHGMYERSSPASRGVADAPRFTPAIELWGQVLSRPEPGLVVLGMGRRDAGFDAGLPVPLRTADDVQAGPDWRVTKLMDQHAYLAVPDSASLSPGDLVCFGISHPCTTLDKWRVIPVVDDGGRITDVVHAFF